MRLRLAKFNWINFNKNKCGKKQQKHEINTTTTTTTIHESEEESGWTGERERKIQTKRMRRQRTWKIKHAQTNIPDTRRSPVCLRLQKQKRELPTNQWVVQRMNNSLEIRLGMHWWQILKQLRLLRFLYDFFLSFSLPLSGECCFYSCVGITNAIR